eukprot:PhF_6_TR26573/c0_g1_i1/m.38449
MQTGVVMGTPVGMTPLQNYAPTLHNGVGPTTFQQGQTVPLQPIPPTSLMPSIQYGPTSSSSLTIPPGVVRGNQEGLWISENPRWLLILTCYICIGLFSIAIWILSPLVEFFGIVVILLSFLIGVFLFFLFQTHKYRTEFDDVSRQIRTGTQRILFWCIPSKYRTFDFDDLVSVTFEPAPSLASNNRSINMYVAQPDWNVHGHFRVMMDSPNTAKVLIGNFRCSHMYGVTPLPVMCGVWRYFLTTRIPGVIVTDPTPQEMLYARPVF